MTGHERLDRAYRRLMWAYPRWYRQDRGLELLTTLLDDASPGQRRPTAGNATDLIRGGLLARVRPPRALGSYVSVALLAVATALLGAALAVRLSPYPGPPDETQAVAAAAVAVPRQPHNVPGPVVRCPNLCPDPTPGDDVVSYDQQPDHTDTVSIRYAFAKEEAAAVVAQARDRLAAAGWQVEPVRVQFDGITSLDAAKDGLTLSMVSATGIYEHSANDGSVTIVVAKDFSTAAAVALALGLAGGLLVGWPTAVWLAHRYRRHGRTRRALILVTAVPVMALTALSAAQATVLTVAMGLDGFTPKDIQIPEFVVTLSVLTPFAARVLVLTAVGLTALPGGRRKPPDSTSSRVPNAPLNA